MYPAKNSKAARRRIGCWLVGLVLLFPGLAWGSEFSALLMIKDGSALVPGRIYVKNGKMRQEFNDVDGQTVTIVRPDKKAVWIVMPGKRTYLEMPLKSRLPGQFIQIPPEALQKHLVGQEKVNGLEAERYDFSVCNKDGLEKQTVWVAPKLGTPVKMTAAARHFTMEYRSIREGNVADRLFELPPGYSKIPVP